LRTSPIFTAFKPNRRSKNFSAARSAIQDADAGCAPWPDVSERKGLHAASARPIRAPTVAYGLSLPRAMRRDPAFAAAIKLVRSRGSE